MWLSLIAKLSLTSSSASTIKFLFRSSCFLWLSHSLRPYNFHQFDYEAVAVLVDVKATRDRTKR
ncbi:hypothetical protein AXX17_AT4G15460 [Arabidopsis thaliana]|uniref:Secreted protein n=1 Tax=Arabidopsis thaliana TaxID=3702 RepID=A0A178UW07_ARATH|nr:hypothetical protein AXX17_AT4G15460 [Arabidopsis thaliana]